MKRTRLLAKSGAKVEVLEGAAYCANCAYLITQKKNAGHPLGKPAFTRVERVLKK